MAISRGDVVAYGPASNVAQAARLGTTFMIAMDGFSPDVCEAALVLAYCELAGGLREDHTALLAQRLGLLMDAMAARFQ